MCDSGHRYIIEQLCLHHQVSNDKGRGNGYIQPKKPPHSAGHQHFVIIGLEVFGAEYKAAEHKKNVHTEVAVGKKAEHALPILYIKEIMDVGSMRVERIVGAIKYKQEVMKEHQESRYAPYSIQV